jgi:non-canonical purine NTP pyrophosphatase (RdgB/HAM1 family)
MRIIIATTNEDKITEFKSFSDEIEFVPPSLTLNIDENGDTFAANAFLKAKAYKEYYPDDYVLADDSGLTIKAIPHILGVETARFLIDQPAYQRYAQINKMLEGKDKDAYFSCVLCLITPNNEIHYFTGESYGKITNAVIHDGFGYDPIFYCTEAKKNYSEMKKKEKNSYSHRGKAMRLLLDFLHG